MNKKGLSDIFYDIHPKYKGLGLIGIAVCFTLSTYYVLIS